ncbi:uncharacterized protein PAC_15856 [Phialocephala subalpina]|uniref:Uncharacterized protein n=1 Tax=Phialocephala subalpina TaxID=576137 RepID=A0A1L7XLY2_9HELO|nr:uncharacterized protein PAC_15856 [Phialocephala subalpina]
MADSRRWEYHADKNGKKCLASNPARRNKCYKCGNDKVKFGREYLDKHEEILYYTWDYCICRTCNEEKHTDREECLHKRCETCDIGPVEGDSYSNWRYWQCEIEKRPGLICRQFNLESTTHCTRCGTPENRKRVVFAREQVIPHWNIIMAFSISVFGPKLLLL